MQKKQKEFTAEEIKQTAANLGAVLAVMGMFLLVFTGNDVKLTINGEDVTHLKKQRKAGLKKRLQLAIAEERYEDAAKLKKLIEAKNLDDDLNKIMKNNPEI